MLEESQENRPDGKPRFILAIPSIIVILNLITTLVAFGSCQDLPMAGGWGFNLPPRHLDERSEERSHRLGIA